MTTTVGGRERLDLAGRWQLAFDPADEGIGRGWAAGRWPDGRSEWVDVPALWNLTHPDVLGVGFYRRLVPIPASWGGRVIRLHVAGACYLTDAWLNGRPVGSHEGAYTPFSFDLTAAARPGEENELVVRVASLARTGPVAGLVLRESPAAKQSWHYTVGGLWGDVAVEAVPPLWGETITVEPDLRAETALVEVAIGNAEAAVRPIVLDLRVTGPDGAVAAAWREPVAVPAGVGRYSALLQVPSPLPWSCEQPHRYRVDAALLAGDEEVDRFAATFGMRDFTVAGGRFFLNGEQIFLRGALLQPNYPIGLVAPRDRGLLEREVVLAQEAGFNLIRVHIAPAAPGLLDLTDRLGMLVYAETSLAWIRDSPRLLDHGRRELTALIERDRNHPSVVFWGILNENRAVAARIADALLRTARALDPTRVVIDNSGGTLAIDQDFGWADRTTALGNRETARQPLHDLHLYLGAPVSTAVWEWLRTLGASPPAVDIAAAGFGSPAMIEEWQRELRDDRGQLFVSEIGCGGMADLDAVVAGFGDRRDLLDARELIAFRDSLHAGFAERGLDRVFGSVQGLVRAAQEQQATGNRRQIEALLINPRVSGYILTQLNDVSWEIHAGMLDLWRNPKPVVAALTRLNRPRCLVLRGAAGVVTCGDQVDVALTLVDRVPAPSGERIAVTVHDPTGAELATSRRDVPAGCGIKALGTIAVQTGRLPGVYRVVARPLGDPSAVGEATETCLALPPVDWRDGPAGIDWVGAVPSVAERLRAAPADDRPRVVVAADPATVTAPEWGAFVAAVEAGATGLVGPLRPRDEGAIRALGLDLRLHFGIGNWLGCYHWVPASELFAGLPAGGLAGEAYADILPHYVLSELGGTVLAGSLRSSDARTDAPRILWFSDVEVVDRGRGRLLFCQYRVFARAAGDPLAGRLLLNLLRVAAAGRD